MAQHVIDCPCIADTHVDQQNYDVNYGTATSLLLRQTADETGLGTGENQRRSLLRFDLTGLPARKKILSVYANVFKSSQSGLGAFRSYLLNNHFEELTTTWSNAPSYSSVSAKNFIFLENGWAKAELNNSVITANPQMLLNGIVLVAFANASTTLSVDINSRENASNNPYIEITYEDSPPLKPTANEPNDVYINLDQDITLSWGYRAEFGGEQKAYKVEWRQQGASSWEEIEETTANNFCVVPADTFPAGNIEWRVYTYNEYDEESPVSDTLKFYAIGQPAAPSVYVEQSATPLITWDAAEQQLWQAQVLNGDTVIYDTGEQPATVWQHRVDDYLDDGDYNARVRARNAYGFWSEWGESGFIVSTAKPTKPTLTVAANNEYSITVSADYDTPTCLLYRRPIGGEYKLIGEVDGAYSDYHVASKTRYEYMARAVNEDYSFADSQPKTGSVALPCSVISYGNTVLPLRNRLESGWGRDYNLANVQVISHYVGRSFPVVETEGFKSQSLSLNYFLTKDEMDTMQELIDAPVILYRNDMGDMFTGTIGNVSYSEQLRSRRGYNATFDIQRVGDG